MICKNGGGFHTKGYNSKLSPWGKILIELVDPEELLTCLDTVPYSEVSNTKINHLFKSEYFIDTLQTKHSIDRDSSSVEHHALRISSLIKQILNNVDIDPVLVYSNSEQSIIQIDDGLHRFRAYLFIKQFLDKTILMPIVVSYDL